MRLLLVRHGEATSKDENSDRPLTDAGTRAVREVASFLSRARALDVSEIRHSAKLRARQTAEIMSHRPGRSGRSGQVGDVPLREVDGLEPMADVAKIADEVARFDRDLMLVGHLPHLDRLASRLVAGAPDREAFDFAAGSVLCLERRAGNPGARWTVQWMLHPKLLR